YVARAIGRVKRECVLPGKQVLLLHLLRCEADADSSDRKRRGKEDIFPPGLTRRGRNWLSRATAGWIWMCATGGVARVEQEITGPPVPSVRHRLHIDSDRWVIERKFSLYTIGVQVLPLPVILEAVSVDNLPVLQLKLDQVNVDRMGIFRQVLEV